MPVASRTASHRATTAPPSPTMSAHTTRTNVGLSSAQLPEHLINRADLRNSLSAFEALLTASKAYTQALIALGSASSDLAVALESCSRLKGAHQVGSGLLAASGVHHMASNSWSILADTFWKEISCPLMEHHDLYVQACADRSAAHDKAIQQRTRALHEAEKRNQRESKSKVGRDLHSFRLGLMELQRHVDELDEEKARYYADVLEGEEECWSFVQDKTTASLRSQMDMFERIANKGMSDPILEPLLSTIADPFSAYGPPRNDDQIFSILHHGSLLSLTHSPNPEREEEGQAMSTANAGEDALVVPGDLVTLPTVLTPADLIMSPSTPSKGLSRVASGATSPKPGNDSTSSVPEASNAVTAANLAILPSTAVLPSDALGISLTAAVDLARSAKTSAQTSVQTANAISESNAELFGTDGEDDGGDEASIFSGTEDDADGFRSTGAALNGGSQSDANRNGKPPTSMANRIIKEKKKKRENAVRANAKTRLKHALSTIDESKGAGVSTTTAVLAGPLEGATTDTAVVTTAKALGERDVNVEPNVDGQQESDGKESVPASAAVDQTHDVDSVWT